MLVREQSPAVISPSAGGHGASRAMRFGRVIGCRVDETTWLIIGLGRVTAGDVVVGLGEDQAVTPSLFVSEWRLAASSPRAKHGFAALLPDVGTDLAMTTIRFGKEETGARYVFAPRLASAEEAAALVVESAGSQSAAVLDRLVDALMVGNVSRRRLLTITALLQSAHASDGFIELIGESHDGATFLQGWSRAMAPGPCRVSVVGNVAPVVAECGIAIFPRPDAPDGASGFVGLLEFQPGCPRPRHPRSGFSGRAPVGGTSAVHPRKRIAGPLETPEHIRSILLRTHGAPDVLLSLRAAANSVRGQRNRLQPALSRPDGYRQHI